MENMENIGNIGNIGSIEGIRGQENESIGTIGTFFHTPSIIQSNPMYHIPYTPYTPFTPLANTTQSTQSPIQAYAPTPTSLAGSTTSATVQQHKPLPDDYNHHKQTKIHPNTHIHQQTTPHTTTPHTTTPHTTTLHPTTSSVTASIASVSPLRPASPDEVQCMSAYDCI